MSFNNNPQQPSATPRRADAGRRPPPEPEPSAPAAVSDATLDEHAAAIKRLAKRVGKDTIRIGQRLIAVRARLGEGGLLSWAEREFGWSRSAVYRYLQVAKVFGDRPNLGRIDPSALYRLAAGDVPDVILLEFEERAEAGEHITYKIVKERLSKERLSGVASSEPAPTNTGPPDAPEPGTPSNVLPFPDPPAENRPTPNQRVPEAPSPAQPDPDSGAAGSNGAVGSQLTVHPVSWARSRSRLNESQAEEAIKNLIPHLDSVSPVEVALRIVRSEETFTRAVVNRRDDLGAWFDQFVLALKRYAADPSSAAFDAALGVEPTAAAET